MKWRVDIEYEDGSFTEPRRIAFQAVYDGEPYYGYDTKREALEAFCQGQFAINQLRKEGGWDKAIKEAKEKYGYGKPEERTDVVRDFSPKEEAEQKKEEEKIKEAKEVAKAYECFPRLKICGEQKPEERTDVVRDFSPEELEKRFGGWNEAIREAHKSPIEKQFEKIEERLTEIEGVLSSIGSPEWELRKKVEELENAIVYLRSKSLAPPWNSQDYPQKPPPVRYDNKVEYYKDNILDK